MRLCMMCVYLLVDVFFKMMIIQEEPLINNNI